VKRELVDYAREMHKLSFTAACEMLGISRSVYRYRPQLNKDLPVVEAIQQVIEENPGFGFPKTFKTLPRRGHPWNHKRVHCVYCLLRLNRRRKGKRRLPTRHPQPLAVPPMANQTWSMDFMSDALMCGRRFRTFNAVDDFNRESLAIEVDLNLPAPRVIRVLDRIASQRGYPERVRMDNGPEFVSVALAGWAEDHDVQLEFIQPGRPMQNSYIERFNRTYRDDVLDLYLFRSLSEVRDITSYWMTKYNEERPHDALQDMAPVEYLMAKMTQENSRNLQA
jgi:putative transposase